MTNSKFNFLIIALFAFGLFFSSCGNNSGSSDQTEKTDQQGKEYTSAYVCPMHCQGSGSDQAGTCPVCGMDYVKNESLIYVCPMHPDITGKQGDKCSICGMDLTAKSDDAHEGHNH